jgi:hypothetical protein
MVDASPLVGHSAPNPTGPGCVQFVLRSTEYGRPTSSVRLKPAYNRMGLQRSPYAGAHRFVAFDCSAGRSRQHKG